MNIDVYHELLRRDYAYRTPEALRPARAARPGSLTTWRYHLGVLRVLLSGCWTASRGQFDRRAWAAHGLRIQQVGERLGSVVSVDGFEVTQSVKAPVVWVANHMGSLETFALPALLLAFGDVATVVKRSLLHYPVFGPSVRGSEPIAVGRENPREDLKTVLQRGTEMLRTGRSVLLFPQATRSSVFRPGRFNSLGAKLAARAGVPVIPVALATDLVGIGRWMRDFGPVTPSRPVHYRAGPVLRPELGAREVQRQSETFIAENLRKWGYEVVLREAEEGGDET